MIKREGEQNNNIYLNDLESFFYKKNKSLNNRFNKVYIEKYFDNEKLESIQIKLIRYPSSGESYSIRAWSDRWIEIYSRKLTKHGKEWEFSYSGRAAELSSWEVIFDEILKFSSKVKDKNSNPITLFSGLRKLIYNGPKELH